MHLTSLECLLFGLSSHYWKLQYLSVINLAFSIAAENKIPPVFCEISS